MKSILRPEIEAQHSMGNKPSSRTKKFLLCPQITRLLNRLPEEKNTWDCRGSNFTIDALVKTCANTALSFGWQPKYFGDIYVARACNANGSVERSLIRNDDAMAFVFYIQTGELVIDEQRRIIEENTCVCINKNIEFTSAGTDYLVVLLERV